MKEGSLTELMSSLNQGAKINACDSEGKTVLHVAAQRDHVEIVDAPLRNNIDVNALDDHQWAPLHLAAAHEGQLAVIQLPLEKCADFLAKNRHDTVLHQTVFGINHEVIKSILGKTVLHVAAQRDHVEIVDAPLQNNIDEKIIKIADFGLITIHSFAEQSHSVDKRQVKYMASEIDSGV